MIGTRGPLARGGVWLGLATLAGIVGCGGGGSGAPATVKVYEVKGTVLLADGKPLGGGHVYFVPRDGAMTPDGRIGPDGTFSLSTGRSGEGAPPGDCKVRIEPEDKRLLAIASPTARRKLPFSPKYLDEDSSGLTATVEPKANQLEPFRLK